MADYTWLYILIVFQKQPELIKFRICPNKKKKLWQKIPAGFTWSTTWSPANSCRWTNPLARRSNNATLGFGPAKVAAWCETCGVSELFWWRSSAKLGRLDSRLMMRVSDFTFEHLLRSEDVGSKPCLIWYTILKHPVCRRTTPQMDFNPSISVFGGYNLQLSPKDSAHLPPIFFGDSTDCNLFIKLSRVLVLFFNNGPCKPLLFRTRSWTLRSIEPTTPIKQSTAARHENPCVVDDVYDCNCVTKNPMLFTMVSISYWGWFSPKLTSFWVHSPASYCSWQLVCQPWFIAVWCSLHITHKPARNTIITWKYNEVRLFPKRKPFWKALFSQKSVDMALVLNRQVLKPRTPLWFLTFVHYQTSCLENGDRK